MEAIFCTLATRSHMAYCRVLAASLARVRPAARLMVLVVDGGPEELPQAEAPNADVLTLADLDLVDQPAFCFQYTAFELCNALKAPLLKFLRGRHPGVPLLYLDSDTYCVGSLDPLVAELAGTPIVLTPHTTVDFPGTGPGLRTQALLQSGVFNAGVIGVGCGEVAERFLDWWGAKLRHDCLRATGEGLFVDQKFLDLVPCLFPEARILRDDGVNVAWFNLHARKLSRPSFGWRANDRPLAVFHFTMLNPLTGAFDPFVQPDPLVTQPILRELTEPYRAALLAAGHERQSQADYGHGRFADGTPVSGRTRRAFREAWMRGEAGGDPFGSPEWQVWQGRFLRREKRADRLRKWTDLLGRINRRLS